MWRIAAPMILSNISVPLLGMVDTGVVGHLESSTYLGGVAIGGMIFTFIYIGMNFLRMGTTGIAAQSYGADDNDGLRVALGQALIVSLAIALALIVLQVTALEYRTGNFNRFALIDLLAGPHRPGRYHGQGQDYRR